MFDRTERIILIGSLVVAVTMIALAIAVYVQTPKATRYLSDGTNVLQKK